MPDTDPRWSPRLPESSIPGGSPDTPETASPYSPSASPAPWEPEAPGEPAVTAPPTGPWEPQATEPTPAPWEPEAPAESGAPSEQHSPTPEPTAAPWEAEPAASAQPITSDPGAQPLTPGQPIHPQPLPAGFTPDPQAAPASSPRTTPRRQRRGPGWSGTIAVAILTALATLGASYLLWGPAAMTSLTRSGAEVATQAPVTQASAQHTNWEQVAKSVQKAVVAIQVQSENSGDTGSGVIFDTQGHVLTNYHVVASAITGKAQIVLQLADGTLYRAHVVGSDATTDLAVLAIEEPRADLQMVALGSSSNLTVGQPVAAIGAPLGLENTMTTGIISALDRPVTVRQAPRTPGSNGGGALEIPGLQRPGQAVGEQVITNAIQVDAAINPGNSGGPLFAADGTVIGITSSIASLGQSEGDTSGSIGIGFAIPVNLAKTVADQILSTGSAKHAYLGVMIRTEATQVDGRSIAGAGIDQVIAGGAAEKAGLAAGDVITSVDGRMVTSGTALTGFVRWYVPGDKVTLEFVRDHKAQKVEVTLGSTEDQKQN